MRQIIVQRKIDLAASKTLPVDILSHMLSALDESGKYMSEMEIVDKILGLMVGAYEPTSSACVSVVKYLAELPHIYDGVYKGTLCIINHLSENLKRKYFCHTLLFNGDHKFAY